MAGESPTYARLNSQWKATCRLLLGKDVGDLDEYKGWLSESLEPMQTVSSRLSGKEIYAVGRYSKGAPFISYDEIDYTKKFKPLSINEIKDIDSIVEAISDRAFYTGNIMLGNSSNVEQSTGIENCHYVYRSHTIHNSQDIAYCTLCREDRTMFGCLIAGESSFVINGHNTFRATRCLQSSMPYLSSDVYYSHDTTGCSDCLFCFSLRSKRHHIGNIPLPKDKYSQIKSKLVKELAEELEREKRLRNISEFIPKSHSRTFPEFSEPGNGSQDFEAMRQSFHKTTEIVLGKPLSDFRQFESYFSKNARKMDKVRSAVSRKDVYYDSLRISLDILNTGRPVKYFELQGISGAGNPKKIADPGKIGLSNIGDLIEPIAYLTPEEFFQGKNTIECPSVYSSANCYRCGRAYFTENSLYSFWPRDAEYEIGCYSTRNSSFCINCFNSFKISRCFEVDTSQNCTGSSFLHNCENVHDSLFCFNAKNLKYAIGNVEMGRDALQKMKSLLLSQVVDELEKKKDFKWSIYNIAKA